MTTCTGIGSDKQSMTFQFERTKVEFFQVSQSTAPLAFYAQEVSASKEKLGYQIRLHRRDVIRISVQCLFKILKK